MATYPVEEIEGIGPTFGAKLKEAGITTTDDFLKMCCDKKGRGAVAQTTGIGESHILGWANMADLMRVSGIGKQFAEILMASGVDTIKELRTRNADNLAAKAEEINTAKNLANATPSLSQVTDWIEKAKAMEPVITH